MPSHRIFLLRQRSQAWAIRLCEVAPTLMTFIGSIPGILETGELLAVWQTFDVVGIQPRFDPLARSNLSLDSSREAHQTSSSIGSLSCQLMIVGVKNSEVGEISEISEIGEIGEIGGGGNVLRGESVVQRVRVRVVGMGMEMGMTEVL